MLYSIENHTGEISSETSSSAHHLHGPADYTDEQLMHRIQDGDEAALGILLYRHVTVCRQAIRRVIQDEAQTDNLTQEVFVEIMREAGRYSEEEGTPLGWILTLARRRAIDRLRHKTAMPGPAMRLREKRREIAPDRMAA